MKNITPELLRENMEKYLIEEHANRIIEVIEEEMLKNSLEGYSHYVYKLSRNINEEDYIVIKKVVNHFVEKGFNVKTTFGDNGKNHMKVSW